MPPAHILEITAPTLVAAPDTADGAVDLSGQQFNQQGEQINEMANTALYTDGQFDD